MAYTKKQNNTEHPSRTIVKMVQAAVQTGVWPRLVLLCGREDFLISWSRDYIKSNVTEPASEALDCVRFTDEAPDISEIISACETMPLLSKRKLIIVSSSELFALQPKGISSDSLERFASYLPNLPESTLLVFCCTKPNKTKALYKACARTGLIYDFTPLDDATLSGWMLKRLRAAGKTASPSELVDFARICGYGDPERSYTLNNLENDLKKIITSCDGDTVSFDQMMELAAPQGELNAFKLLDSAFSGRKNDAFSILHSTLDIQAPSKAMGSIMSFLGLLCSQLEIMVEAREREDEGFSFYEIAQDMGANEYRLKKALSASRSRSTAQLRASLFAAFQVEKDIKGGLLEARTALELFIANL